MAKTIWIMRHAENHKDESLKLALTDDGVRKSSQLGTMIAADDANAPTLILSSSSMRGRQTAELLRDTFTRCAKNAYAVMNDRIASDDVADTLGLVGLIADLKEICAANHLPNPESLIMVTHKQNELFHVFRSILDPVAYFNGTASPDVVVPTLSHLVDNIEHLSDEEIAARFGGTNEVLETPNYLDALRFDLRVPEWADFGLNCAQFRRKLEIV